MFCRYCGNEIPEDSIKCPKCEAPAEPLPATYTVPLEVDEPSMGLNILSLVFPIVGLILYLVYMDKSPKRARPIGKFAIIGAAIGFTLSILTFGILPIMLFMFY
jgi:hypothetical protein